MPARISQYSFVNSCASLALPVRQLPRFVRILRRRLRSKFPPSTGISAAPQLTALGRRLSLSYQRFCTTLRINWFLVAAYVSTGFFGLSRPTQRPSLSVAPVTFQVSRVVLPFECIHTPCMDCTRGHLFLSRVSVHLKLSQWQRPFVRARRFFARMRANIPLCLCPLAPVPFRFSVQAVAAAMILRMGASILRSNAREHFTLSVAVGTRFHFESSRTHISRCSGTVRPLLWARCFE